MFNKIIHFSVEDRVPTNKGDVCDHSFVSEDNITFQGTWSRATQSVKRVIKWVQHRLRHETSQ